MIHSVVHNYHPETTEPINFHYQVLTQITNSYEFNRNDLYRHLILNNTACNVQPSQKLAPRVFPILPYFTKVYNFWRIFIFNILISMVLNLFNSGKFMLILNTFTLHIVMMSEILLLPFGLDWSLMLNYNLRDLIKFLFITATNWILYWKIYKKNWNIETNWFNASWKTKLRKNFSDSGENSKKNDSNKIVLNARYLNSNTDKSSESWPLVPLATQLAKANKKNQICNWSDVCICISYITWWNYQTDWILIW